MWVPRAASCRPQHPSRGPQRAHRAQQHDGHAGLRPSAPGAGTPRGADARAAADRPVLAHLPGGPAATRIGHGAAMPTFRRDAYATTNTGLDWDGVVGLATRQEHLRLPCRLRDARRPRSGMQSSRRHGRRDRVRGERAVSSPMRAAARRLPELRAVRLAHPPGDAVVPPRPARLVRPWRCPRALRGPFEGRPARMRSCGQRRAATISVIQMSPMR